MSKFNWDKYFEDLEEGDPKKFPYWQFFVNEIVLIFDKLITGIVSGIMMTFIILGTIFAVLNYVSDNPEIIPEYEFYCEQFNAENENN